MYEQDLFKIIEPIKKTTISRLNKGKKWKYGYDKEHDIVVISKTGKIGEVIEIQGLRIGLPLEPKGVYVHPLHWLQRQTNSQTLHFIDFTNSSSFRDNDDIMFFIVSIFPFFRFIKTTYSRFFNRFYYFN